MAAGECLRSVGARCPIDACCRRRAVDKQAPRRPCATVEEVAWVAEDGIRYLLPEIVLVFKARLRRPKDEPDFEATLPILTAEQREWMRNPVTRVAPDHPWLERF